MRGKRRLKKKTIQSKEKNVEVKIEDVLQKEESQKKLTRPGVNLN